MRLFHLPRLLISADFVLCFEWLEELQLFQQAVATWEPDFTLTVRSGWLPPAGGHHNSLAKSIPLRCQNKRRLDRRSPVLLRALHPGLFFYFFSAGRRQFFYHSTSPLSSPDGRDITWEGQTPISLDDNLIYVCMMVIQGTCPRVTPCAAQTTLSGAASLLPSLVWRRALLFFNIFLQISFCMWKGHTVLLKAATY